MELNAWFCTSDFIFCVWCGFCYVIVFNSVELLLIETEQHGGFLIKKVFFRE